MIPHDLLKDNINTERAEEIQIKYAKMVREQEPKLYIVDLSDFDKIERVAGVDISYYKKGTLEFGVSCAVVWDVKKGKIIYKDCMNGLINFPYQAGFLGFREGRLLAEVLYKLIKDDMQPDVVMCDGQGIIHPRRFGEAVHIGLVTNIPTFGVAKNPYIGFSDMNALGNKKGDKVSVLSENPDLQQSSNTEVLGYTIRLNDKAKPVYISRGYRITLDLAVKIALDTTFEHRQPEPLFLADKFSRENAKELESNDI